MRIALAQIRSTTDPAANLRLVEEHTRQAVDAGAAMVLFPEATMCRFGVPLGDVAEPFDDELQGGVEQVRVGHLAPAGPDHVCRIVVGLSGHGVQP